MTSYLNKTYDIYLLIILKFSIQIITDKVVITFNYNDIEIYEKI